MATDDPVPVELASADSEPQPALADWWVWGVRKIAGVAAELLMISRGFALLCIMLKLGAWARESPDAERWLAQRQQR